MIERFVVPVFLTLVAGAAFAQSKPTKPPATEAAAKIQFDRAILTNNGALFHSVMRPREVQGLTVATSQKFLDEFVKPLSSGLTPAVRKNNTRIYWKDKDNPIRMVFKRTGGHDYVVVEKRALTFETPTLKEGGGFRSTVGFAQILFCLASIQAQNTGRDRFVEAQFAHDLVKSWIPKVKKMGIKGSIDPETGKYLDWNRILAESQAEIARLKRPR